MINKITVVPDSRASHIFFFKEMDITKLPDPRIVPLFGPNGAGKSTLISAIINAGIARQPQIVIDRTSENMHVYAYENSKDNFKAREARSYSEAFDPFFLSSRFDARSISEGQSIIYSAFDLLDGLKPGKNMFGSEDSETLVLLDEIDSGMSIDNIDTAMRKIKYALSKRNDLQIFMSFNSPRILKHFPNVISMYDGSILTLHTDEDMLAEIRKHKTMFDKARKTAKGRPKIFE